MTQVDVLVIGGGPGGTPAAMALANGGRRVLLVEKGTGLRGAGYPGISRRGFWRGGPEFCPAVRYGLRDRSPPSRDHRQPA